MATPPTKKTRLNFIRGLVTRPKYPPPYRETNVAIPLSHCVSCGIADVGCLLLTRNPLFETFRAKTLMLTNGSHFRRPPPPLQRSWVSMSWGRGALCAHWKPCWSHAQSRTLPTQPAVPGVHISVWTQHFAIAVVLGVLSHHLPCEMKSPI